MSKKLSQKQQEQQQENLSFDPYTVQVEKLTTSIQLLSCQEESVVLASLIAIDAFSRKDPSCVEALLESGLQPNQLLSMSFETGFLSLDSSARRFAAKILTRLVKIPEIRESLLQGVAYCLASLQRDDGDPMNEFSSNILSELLRGKSSSYAASILISPPVDLEHPLQILFTRLSSTKDPDVIYNCLKNIWQLLFVATVLPDSNLYIASFDQYLALEILPPLFQCSYPSIQLLAMAVAYEGAIGAPAAGSKLFSSFPQLLALLESPENSAVHCTILALISKLLTLSNREGKRDEADDPEDLFVDCDGPSRLLKYYLLHSLERDDLCFWSLISVLTLFALPSAATVLINEHQFHTNLPDLINDEDSRVAVAAAHALSCIWRYKEPVKEIVFSKVAKYLAALVARWPGDLAVPYQYHQTFEGCSIAARALERLIRDYPYARAAFVYDIEERHSDRKSSGVNNSASLNSSQKISQSLIYVEDVLEKMGKLPDDCISSILKVVAILAKNVKLRPLVVAAEGLVASVVDSLHAPSHRPEVVEPPDLPEQWPKTTKDLECLLLERFSRGGVWKEKAPQLSNPSLMVPEEACVALGFLLLEPKAEQIFLRNKGAARILYLLKRNEKGFGGKSLLQAILFLIAHCPTAIANALIYNGALHWMMKNEIFAKRNNVSTSWDDTVTHLLNSNPSAKFQVEGRLDAGDDSGDLFYIVCPRPRSFSSFKSISEYRDSSPKPSNRVYVACWSAFDDSPLLRGSHRRSSGERGSLDSLEADHALLSYESELKDRQVNQPISLSDGLREKVVMIAKFVWEVMSIPTDGINFDFELYMEELKISIGEGDVIPLSRMRMGNYTERAMLFKVLADRLGIPAALVRGPYGRSWIEVALEDMPEKATDLEEDERGIEIPKSTKDVEEGEREEETQEMPKNVEEEDRGIEIPEKPKDEAKNEREIESRKNCQSMEEVKPEVVGKKEESKEYIKEKPIKKREKKKIKDKVQKNAGSRRKSNLTDISSEVLSESKEGETKPKIIEKNLKNEVSESFLSVEKEEFSRSESESLNIPTSPIQPNHVVDLMTNIGRMYPIGSREANVYCGFQSNSSENLPRPPYCTCWKNPEEIKAKKISKIGENSKEESNGYVEDDEYESVRMKTAGGKVEVKCTPMRQRT